MVAENAHAGVPGAIAGSHRTGFLWLGLIFRHSRDYERLTATCAAMIQISIVRLLLNRLA
jgi:hypothetical protein